jgi:hypothetical protein
MTLMYNIVYFLFVCFIVFMLWFARGGHNYITVKYDLLKGEFK